MRIEKIQRLWAGSLWGVPSVSVVGIIIWSSDVKETEDGCCVIKRQRKQKDSAGRLRKW